MTYFILLAIGLTLGYIGNQFITKTQSGKLEKELSATLKTVEANIRKTKKEAEEKLTERKKEMLKEKEAFEKEISEKTTHMEKREEFVKKREDIIIEKKEHVKKGKEACRKEMENIQNHKKETVLRLVSITGESVENIKNKIIEQYDTDLKNEFQEYAMKEKEIFEDKADVFAHNLIIANVQKYTQKNASKIKFEPVALSPNLWEKHKDALSLIPKISEVEFDYNPEKKGIFVAYYHIVRRAIAHEALTKVIQKKCFAENDIKKELKLASDKIHANMMKLGKEAFTKLRIPDSMFPDELKKLVGRLYYRTSYGQNIYEHSIEVAFFSGMIAGEIGADIQIAKLAGLFHDLGKAIDQDTEGSHDVLTKQILEEYNIDPRVVHAAWNHHDAIEMESTEARIVQVADAISAARPAARAETGEQLKERVEMLLNKASLLPDIEKCYVIQAGREIRATFNPKRTSDEKVREDIKALAKSIEEEGGYPGKIMVRGVRELKVVERIDKDVKRMPMKKFEI